jgi:subtilisin family serine protease
MKKTFTRGIRTLTIAILSLTALALILSTSYKSKEIEDPLNPEQTSSGSNTQGGVNNTNTKEERNTPTNHTVNQSAVERSKILQNNKPYEEKRYYLMDVPNDPGFSNNWANSKIQTSFARKLSTGSESVKVAVIDSPFALEHEDLIDSWHINQAETGLTEPGDFCWSGSPEDKATNQCDDDQNGFIDDWRGYDFFNEDNDPSAGTTNPNGEGVHHGSLVSGVIASKANNSKGGAGLAPETKIMPLQVFNDDGEAYTSDIVSAIEYAVDSGVDIINLSLGTNGYDAPMAAAIEYAKTNDVIVVAASGNCALNDQLFCQDLAPPGRMSYPAKLEYVIAVGSSNNQDYRSNFSSYGSELSLVAPGQSVGPLPIFNQNNNASYATASGTSFSAPLVSATASLLKSQNSQLSSAQVREIIEESTDRPADMNGNVFSHIYGYGRLNAHKATLLARAKQEANLLGTDPTSPKQVPTGRTWRIFDSNIVGSEWIVVGCRLQTSEVCRLTLRIGSSTYRFSPIGNQKGKELQYIFISGSSAPSGTWNLNVHNSEFANLVAGGTLVK